MPASVGPRRLPGLEAHDDVHDVDPGRRRAPSGTTCADTYKKQDSYEYYVVAVDNAGNISAQSNHVTK